METRREHDDGHGRNPSLLGNVHLDRAPALLGHDTAACRPHHSSHGERARAHSQRRGQPRAAAIAESLAR